ncbi:MAG TPA: hypothetical protein ENI94_12110 [Gammaproteobacteria bacterium]|nr:hypothetical protein [Gammaproteobacteria bacterium]
MKLQTLEAIFRALNEAGVRYLVVGGLAVNVHGYQRLTNDLDLVIQLGRDNILAAFQALSSLGYQASVPVTPEQFASAENRQKWQVEKNMQVLCLVSNQHPETPLDIFITEPFDFDREYEAALRGGIAKGLEVRFVTIPTLIAMKEFADRERDRDDIQHLRWILEEQKEND